MGKDPADPGELHALTIMYKLALVIASVISDDVRGRFPAARL
jgi:hypothetical protein